MCVCVYKEFMFVNKECVFVNKVCVFVNECVCCLSKNVFVNKLFLTEKCVSIKNVLLIKCVC